MNETNAPRPQRKRRSFLWLWILLILFAFAGGIILGLNLNTVPMPRDVRARLYPVLEAMIPGSTGTSAPIPADAVPPQAIPAPVAQTPAPAPTDAYPAPPAETPPAPETVPPVQTDALTGFAIADTKGPIPEDAAPVESAAAPAVKYIGIDAALEAALKHAEVEKKDANVTGVYRTKDADGQAVYEVGFTVGEISYDYVLSAEDGEILGWKMSGLYMEDLATFGGAEPAPAPVPESEKP